MATGQAREARASRGLLDPATSGRLILRENNMPDLADPRESRALSCYWVVDAQRLLSGFARRPSFGTRPDRR